MTRYGWVIGVKDEKIAEYKRLYADVRSDVLAMIKQCHIEDYSICLQKRDDGRTYLFSSLEYTGNDFDADMAKMATDPTTQKWRDVCKPCQKPLSDRGEGQWLAAMEEVFHLD